MPPGANRATPSSRDPNAVAALKRAFASAGYTFDAVRKLLGADETLSIPPQQVPFAARGLGDSPLATLARLFLVHAPVTLEQATAALRPLSLQQAVTMGIVSMGRSRVHGAVRVLPSDGCLFASDLDSDDPSQLPADFVMNVTDSSRLLARLTIRRPVELALDLGAGCGYQAVLAARHAERVIATDVNARALAFTEFNALLNGATNVECRRGDRFTAVDDLTFDLIVSNPPFVISPDRAFVYRDAGLAGDRVSREIVEQAMQRLRPDGLAHVLVGWIHAMPDDDWSAPLRDWVANSGCDAWLLRKGSYDPLAYAVMWNQRLALANHMQRYMETVDRWLRYYENLHVPALAYGAVVVRRRADGMPPRIRENELPDGAPDGSLAGELERLMHVEDFLQSVDDETLRGFKLTMANDQRLEQVLRWREGSFRVDDASLLRERGLKPRADVDTPLAALLAQVDGTRRMAEVVERTAEALSIPEAGTETFRAQATSTIRELVAHGFLELARPED
jgi:SAM-dependent methyltransferase